MESNAGDVPFKPVHPPLCRGAVAKRIANAEAALIDSLATIWDEVVHRVIVRMMDLARPDENPVHINLREEMALELAKLQLWLGDAVVEKRLAGRAPSDIEVEQERRACLGPEGASIIGSTADIVYERIWSKLMEARWKPKSAKALERDANSQSKTLAVKPVGKNHFIPRWFIRDLWSVDGKVRRWRKGVKGWSSNLRSFSKWGFGHKLYSDQLEAYFGLLEGDAKRPIEMLLDTKPLNGPQRDAFVGFLVVQLLRNPSFIDFDGKGIEPILAELGHSDDPAMLGNAYEAIFQDNDLYHQLAHPVMWSRWAIVRSKSPIFVLPDTFGIRGDTGGGMRLLVPLTPTACFVTLPDREEQKRIVPRHLQADEELARRMSSSLIHSSAMEFLSHPEFEPDILAPEPFGVLLEAISRAVARGSGGES